MKIPSWVTLRFSRSTRGKPLLQFGPYKFLVHTTNGPKIRWHCARQRKYNCRARLVTIDATVIGTMGCHNHDPGE
ncbi:FLYWCH zinc finger domain-containing protein [Phthorimaea operculella]|nr:FLYWCH zinc finger domain-containing protein [Phthorimaea operculella]